MMFLRGNIWRAVAINRLQAPTVLSVYDPFGFLAPLVLRAKKILPEICRRGVSWDEPLPEDIRPR